MIRSQDVLTNHTLVKYDSILIVVTLPRHVCHEQVTTECQLTILRCVTFSQDITLLDTLSLFANRTEVNGHILVGTAELRNDVFFYVRIEADEILFFRTVISNANRRCVNVLYLTFAFSGNHRTRIFANLLFDTRTYDRRFTANQRNCLTHHVRSHQCTVGVVVFQERNQRSCDRGNLLRSHIHQFNFRGRNNGIVGILTTLYFVTDEGSVVIQRSVTLADNLLFLFFC